MTIERRCFADDTYVMTSIPAACTRCPVVRFAPMALYGR